MVLFPWLLLATLLASPVLSCADMPYCQQIKLLCRFFRDFFLLNRLTLLTSFAFLTWAVFICFLWLKLYSLMLVLKDLCLSHVVYFACLTRLKCIDVIFFNLNWNCLCLFCKICLTFPDFVNLLSLSHLICINMPFINSN